MASDQSEGGEGHVLHRRIYDRIRTGILEGTLAPGSRLSSSRALAGQLGVARGTIEAAYQLLAGEGYILTEGARGTFVAAFAPEASDGRPAIGASEPVPSREDERRAARLAFHVGIPALDLFPRKAWAAIAARNARKITIDGLNYPDARGLTSLRSAIAGYLRVARGVTCTTDQVLITGGYQSALTLVTQLLTKAGDRVIVENPGYFRGRQALDMLNVEQVPVPVDGDGIDVASVERVEGAALCVVTPSNQFPLSVKMSAARRARLLRWARGSGSWIVEDDYDGEFYYGARGVPALKSDDRDDRVIYVGTFSKTIYPALRLGFMVLPSALMPIFAQGIGDLDGGRSLSDQAVLAEFVESGQFARHLQHMRAAYKARRMAILREMQQQLGDEFEFEGNGGIHLVAWSKRGRDDVVLRQSAARAGFRVLAVSEASYGTPSRTGLILGVTNPTIDKVPGLVKAFGQALFAERKDGGRTSA